QTSCSSTCGTSAGSWTAWRATSTRSRGPRAACCKLWLHVTPAYLGSRNGSIASSGGLIWWRRPPQAKGVAMRHLLRKAEVAIVLVGAATLANLIVLVVAWR